jgi:hypothetical protein
MVGQDMVFEELLRVRVLQDKVTPAAHLHLHLAQTLHRGAVAVVLVLLVLTGYRVLVVQAVMG